MVEQSLGMSSSSIGSQVRNSELFAYKTAVGLFEGPGADSQIVRGAARFRGEDVKLNSMREATGRRSKDYGHPAISLVVLGRHTHAFQTLLQTSTSCSFSLIFWNFVRTIYVCPFEVVSFPSDGQNRADPQRTNCPIMLVGGLDLAPWNMKHQYGVLHTSRARPEPWGSMIAAEDHSSSYSILLDSL